MIEWFETDLGRCETVLNTRVKMILHLRMLTTFTGAARPLPLGIPADRGIYSVKKKTPKLHARLRLPYRWTLELLLDSSVLGVLYKKLGYATGV